MQRDPLVMGAYESEVERKLRDPEFAEGEDEGARRRAAHLFAVRPELAKLGFDEEPRAFPESERVIEFDLSVGRDFNGRPLASDREDTLDRAGLTDGERVLYRRLWLTLVVEQAKLEREAKEAADRDPDEPAKTAGILDSAPGAEFVINDDGSVETDLSGLFG